MENTNIESENSIYQLKSEFINQLVNSYKEHYGIEVNVEKVVMVPGNTVMDFHMISSDELRFCVYFDTDPNNLNITDNYIQALCARQIENYIGLMIKDAYIKVSFIEEFSTETTEGILYDEYISKHQVSDVIVKIFATEGSVEESVFETIHQTLFQKVKVPVTYFLYSYDAENYQQAVDELKGNLKLTKYVIDCTKPSSVKFYRKDNGEI